MVVGKKACLGGEVDETKPDVTEQVMAKLKLMYGTKTPRLDYRHVALENIVGKTVQGVAETTVQGENGNEPCLMLLFTDGTKHGFVLPGDNRDEQSV
jgi:hypothetical protein